MLKVKLAQKCLKDIVAPFPFSTPPYYSTQPTGLLLCTDLYGTGTGRHKRVRSRAYYRPSFLFSVDFSLEALYLYLSSLGAKMLDHQYTKKSICIPTITILGTYVTLEKTKPNSEYPTRNVRQLLLQHSSVLKKCSVRSYAHSLIEF